MKKEKTSVCGVCGRRAQCSHVSSGMAPISYSMCHVCEARGAESLDIICDWITLSGGLKVVEDHSAFCQRLIAFSDIKNDYIGWREIRSYYIENDSSKAL